MQIAAKFGELGSEKTDITRAWAAIQNPDFYRELGRSVQEDYAAGVRALAERYGFTPPETIPNIGA